MSSIIEADGIPLAGDLLHLYTFKGDHAKKAVPLAMEFKVNLDTGPFLVSSARATLWVTPRQPKVRAAFRPMQSNVFFGEVVEAVVKMGLEAEWGNVQPLTRDGVMAAVAHVLSYDLPAPEVLAHPDVAWGDIPVTTKSEGSITVSRVFGCQVQRADWLDPGTVVVVPQNREFVGFVLVNGTRGLAVVHNASRGIAVCRNRA